MLLLLLCALSAKAMRTIVLLFFLPRIMPLLYLSAALLLLVLKFGLHCYYLNRSPVKYFIDTKTLKNVDAEGFEPSTFSMQSRRSTTDLSALS